jgi:hypothetical protein
VRPSPNGIISTLLPDYTNRDLSEEDAQLGYN